MILIEGIIIGELTNALSRPYAVFNISRQISSGRTRGVGLDLTIVELLVKGSGPDRVRGNGLPPAPAEMLVVLLDPGYTDGDVGDGGVEPRGCFGSSEP